MAMLFVRPGNIYTEKNGTKRYLCLRGNTPYFQRAVFCQLSSGFVFESDSPEVYPNGSIYFYNHFAGHSYGTEISDEIYGDKYFDNGNDYPWRKEEL